MERLFNEWLAKRDDHIAVGEKSMCYLLAMSCRYPISVLANRSAKRSHQLSFVTKGSAEDWS